MPNEAYVWAWLPGATTPVVAGRVAGVSLQGRDSVTFEYQPTYLRNQAAIALSPELPMAAGVQVPAAGLDVFGVLLDAIPDGWGRHVIDRTVLAREPGNFNAAAPDLFTYMLQSASDRIGGLDFQQSATDYLPRGPKHTPALLDLVHAAEMLERGDTIPESFADAVLLGTAVGGSRPKAIINIDNRSYIAKFSSTTDHFPVVKSEAVAMELARRLGIQTAHTQLENAGGRDVLLVQRFDRPSDGTRRMQVSALTVLVKNADTARGATSYPGLADKIRESFTNPRATLTELFKRVVFNVMVRNTDNHARNEAAFWDGKHFTLTPAYDISPGPGRRDSVASHPMAITPDGDNRSLLAVCVKAAPVFQLTSTEAKHLVEEMDEMIRLNWDDAATMAQLTTGQRRQLWEASILNPAIYWSM